MANGKQTDPIVCTWSEWEELTPEQQKREHYKILKALDERTMYIVNSLSPESYKPFIRKWSILTSAAITLLFLAGLVGLKFTVGI